MNKEQDESNVPEYDGDSVQMNVDSQLYTEKSITEDSENVTRIETKNHKEREILEQTDSLMKNSSNEPDQRTNSQNDISRRVMRQQTQGARSVATRTRNQSQTHAISLGYPSVTSQSVTLFAGPSKCRFY